MSEQIELWCKRLDEITDSFQRDFSSLSEQDLNWKPVADIWSIAQIIDHLIVTNRSYFPEVEKARSGKYRLPVTAKLNFLINFFGDLVYKSMLPENSRKIKTFPIWQPASSNIPKEIIKKFADSQTNLKTLIKNSIDLIEKRIVILSPASRIIAYRLDKAFDIIVAHELRHLKQAKELKKALIR